MNARTQPGPSRKEARAGMFLGVVLLLLFAGGAAYLLTSSSDRSDLVSISGVIRSKQSICSKFLNRCHIEFFTPSHHLYYGGPELEKVGPHIEPGVRIEALVRPHNYRDDVLIVEEISAGGQLLVLYEDRRLFFRCFGYIALFLGIAPAAYTFSCWRVLSRRSAA